MNSTKPVITIITICYNASDCLEKTIQSVITQEFAGYEYIIIDGGSTDGTQRIIERYADRLSCWVSEPDKGISDAFNKGIKHATGDYMVMLNAGDTFLSPDVLAMVSKHLTEKIVSFRYRQEGSPFISRIISPDAPIMKRSLVGHQATFVHQSVYASIGGYSLAYSIRMDYDFFLRAFRHYQLAFHEEVIVMYNAGLSGAMRSKMRYEAEGITAEFLNLKKSPWYLVRVLYIPLWRIMRGQLAKVYHSLSRQSA